MNERIYLLEEADPVLFFGPNGKNLVLLRSLFPKLRLMARGNIIKIIGEGSEAGEFLKLLNKLEKHTVKYNDLSEESLLEIVRGETPKKEVTQDIILYGNGGRPISPLTHNQKEMVRLIEANHLLFATGPAGSGKTFIAIAMAVKMLKTKQVKRIILSRPAVEAGEKLGFLPGEMKDKLDPYLQPLYDALQELIPPLKLKEYVEVGVIQIAPLAFMRGRTLNDAVVILDEAQNTTGHQMKMFLTRLGQNARMIVTGDVSQIDLPRGVQSGLKEALHVLAPTPGIGFIQFERQDIARHPLVKAIVEAYEKHERLHQKEDNSPPLPQSNKRSEEKEHNN